MEKEERLLTPEQVRTFLNVSQPTFRRMVASGDIPAVRIGKRLIRIRESDLESVLKPVETSAEKSKTDEVTP